MQRKHVVLTLTICLGASSLQAASPDAWLTAKTKLSLLTEEGVNGTRIHVDTTRGQVTLHGKVGSEQEKTRAEALARKIDGVKAVRNLLQVVPEASRESVKASDEQIADAVREALDNDASLEDSNIEVQSVNAGVVLLSGKAASVSDELRAAERARSIAGVKRVASEVKAPGEMTDAEMWSDKLPSGGEVAGTIGDAWLTTAVKMRLMADEDTPATDINVDTRDGVVTLFGIVPSDASKAAAEAEARKVGGVSKVENLLQVVALKDKETVAAKDADVQMAVEKALEAEEGLAQSDVDVEVKNGVARLTGTVRSGSDRLLAAVTARSVSGVRSVHQELKIDSATASR